MLITNSSIDQVVEMLRATRLTRDQLLFYGNKNNPDRAAVYQDGELAERAIKQLISDARIPNVTPYDRSTVTGNIFELNETAGASIVYHQNTEQAVREWDGLWFAQDTPLIAEVKLCVKRSDSGNQNALKDKIKHVLRGDREVRDQPIVNDLFGFYDYGFIYIVTPETLESHSPLLNQFQERGGHLVPFPCPLETYRSADEIFRAQFK